MARSRKTHTKEKGKKISLEYEHERIDQRRKFTVYGRKTKSPTVRCEVGLGAAGELMELGAAAEERHGFQSEESWQFLVRRKKHRVAVATQCSARVVVPLAPRQPPRRNHDCISDAKPISNLPGFEPMETLECRDQHGIRFNTASSCSSDRPGNSCRGME